METVDELFPELNKQPVQQKNIEQLFPELNKQPKPAETPKGDAYDQIAAPSKSMVGGIAGNIAGGLVGAVSAPFVGVDEAVNNLNSVRDSISKWIGDHPDSEQAQRGIQILENSLKDIEGVVNFATGGTAGLANLALNPSEGIEGAQQEVNTIRDQGLSKSIGNDVFNKTGSPLLAAGAELIPVIGEMAAGKRVFTNTTPVKSKLLEKIEVSPNDPKYAHLAVVDEKVVNSRSAKEAIKQGFDKSVIGTIKNASKEDKINMTRMVNKLAKSKSDALYAAKNRPADVAGDSLLKRVNYVKKQNRKFGSELEKVAESLRGKPVNFDDAINKFQSNLSEIGVKLDDNFKPNFKGSDIEGVKGAESAVNKIVQRLKNQNDVDAYGVHRVKRYIDEQVSYNKSVKGLSGKSERILKELRRDLDSALDSNFPDYDKVNTGYADTVTALDELQVSAGRKLDLFGDNADKAVGTLLRRLMSNAQGRVTLMDSIDSIESVASKYGGKFNDDITTQVLFVDELDRLFGAPAKTSFQGEIIKGTDTAISNLAEAKVSPITAAAKSAASVAERARGINEENAIKSIRELLKDK